MDRIIRIGENSLGYRLQEAQLINSFQVLARDAVHFAVKDQARVLDERRVLVVNLKHDQAVDPTPDD